MRSKPTQLSLDPPPADHTYESSITIVRFAGLGQRKAPRYMLFGAYENSTDFGHRSLIIL